jgi:hypothetical protein
MAQNAKGVVLKAASSWVVKPVICRNAIRISRIDTSNMLVYLDAYAEDGENTIRHSQCGDLIDGSGVQGNSYELPDAVAALTGNPVSTNPFVANYFTVSISSSTLVTMSAPIHSFASREITYEISNDSQDQINVYWDSGAFRLAGSFEEPDPGENRTIKFQYNGLYWVETARS